MTESPARYDITALHIHNTHQSDCGFCADINARLVALERIQEEDRQAIRGLADALSEFNPRFDGFVWWAAAIQRAQERP